MANELRMYSFALNFDGSQGITGVKNFTKALTDAKAAEDLLNASLGAGVTATIENVKSANDILKQAKLLADQFARTEKNANTLNAQYRLQTDILGKTREETERLNAISKLGSGATLDQISSVMSSINAFQQRRAAVEAAEAVDAAYDAELKQQIAIAQQTANTVNQLTSQYKLQTQQLGMNKDAIERMNALNKLGESASSSQRAEVLASVAAYQQERNAIEARNKAKAQAQTVSNVVSQYQNQAQQIGLSREALERYNAVAQLGANATSAQIKEVLASVGAFQQQRTIVEETAKAQARATAAAAQAQQLTNAYKLQTQQLGLNREALERLNAITQLGANATAAQRASVLASLQAFQQRRALLENQTSEQNMNNRVRELTLEIQRQRQMVGLDTNAIERLNAVHRLGANATEAHRQQILAEITALQQARAAAEGTGGSLRNFRGVMQNVGWQVQDTVVQLQMGTSAFVVLSQQGSQFAAAFGPTGAVVGAVIAVAGVVAMQLLPSLKNAGTAAEQVDKVFQSVNKTMKDGANDADIYTESFVKLYNANKSLGLLQLRLELSKLDSASTIASEGISKSIGKIGDDVLSVPVVPMDGFTQVNSGVLQITGTMGNSAPVLDGYTKSLLDLKNVSADINKNGFNDQNLKAYESALLSVSKTGDIANKDLQAFLQTNNEILVSQISITNKKKELQKALSELGVSDKPLLTPQQKQDTKDTLREFDSLSNALIKKTETTQEEYLRQKAIIDKASKAEGSDPEKIKTVYAALEAWKTAELKKESDKRSKTSTTAWNKEDAEFQSLAKSLVKQTNTTQEEYDRRKAIIDAHVKAVGSTDSQAAKAYADLEAWKTAELKKESDKRSKASTTAWNKEDAEFQSLAKSLVKQTNTTQEEYDRRKAIIDAHVKAVGSTDAQAAQAYIDLEVWKTSELDKELKTREAVLKQLQDAQDTQFGKTNPVGQENDLFKENQAKLHQLWLDNQLSQQTNHDQKLIDEEMRINALMEREAKRHTDKLDKIALNQKETELQTYADFTSSLGNVFSQLQQAAQDGSKEAQILFYINRAIALAETIINTELAATKALSSNANPIFGIPAASMIRAMGYASAGIIAGTTFAGAYDAGGYIPSGSSGIVSEYADELVNGTLVQGPAHVTSSAKTAQKMGTTLNVQVANQIDGATYDVQQIDEETVKIIARRELSKNIDKSVASVMSNPNSRTRKATSSSYSLKRKF